jgi:Carboxypeptidase regulatory-like domain
LDGKPLQEVTVEVFDNPEALIQPEKSTEYISREPIASCVTDASGTFSFPGLAPGKYELRFRKHEFDILSVMITFAPNKKGASKRPLRIAMRTAA